MSGRSKGVSGRAQASWPEADSSSRQQGYERPIEGQATTRPGLDARLAGLQARRAVRFAAPETAGAGYQATAIRPMDAQNYPELRPSASDRMYHDAIGSTWSTYTGGPQGALGDADYNDADCGQYAHGSVVYHMNSVNPQSGEVSSEGTRFVLQLNSANKMPAASFVRQPIPAAARAVAFVEPNSGAFHFARVVRTQDGRAYFSHTEASTHDEMGGGGTFRIHDLQMNTYAQRGVAPTETFATPTAFAAYCQRKYGDGDYVYTTTA